MKKIDYNDGRINVWSSGGGVQSSAIAVLIANGTLPKPDLAVIADTEREATSTWNYLENHIQPMLDKVGVKVHRVKKSEFAKDDMYCKDNLLIPAFSRFNGEDGKQPGFCSRHWKKDVVERYCRQQFEGAKAFNMWMGISTDELKRAKPVLGKWQKKYPLIELIINRYDCIAIVLKAGLPEPPRSSCWMCPNRSDTEWKLLKQNNPADFNKAIKLEKDIRKDNDYIFLSKEYKTLDKVDFSDDDEQDLFGTCDSGMCFT
jgi:hypothetical protein